MTVTQKDDYYISVGESNHHKRYRMHILNHEGNVVHSDLIKNGEFTFCKLHQGEYEIYVSPVVNVEPESKFAEE